MKFPLFSAEKAQRIEIPQLNGGYCRHHDGSDNSRLFDVRNMWWKNGALTTRPGLSASGDQLLPAADAATTDWIRWNDQDTLHGGAFSRRMLWVESDADGETVRPAALTYDGRRRWLSNAYTLSDNEEGEGVFVSFDSRQLQQITDRPDVSGEILFLRSGEILGLPASATGDLIPINRYAYVPIIRRDGSGVTAPFGEKEMRKITGVSAEEHNLLTPRFRMSFTTDGNASVFYLPYTCLDETEITASYTAADGTVYTYTVPVGTHMGLPAENGFEMHVDRAEGYVRFYLMGNPAAFPAGWENNLVVTASKTMQDTGMVFGMRRSLWFGGGDMSSGARLFMAGHPQYPGILAWSAAGNPLYFPASHRMAAGDPSQEITALARQGSLMIVFKPQEIYAVSGEAKSFTVMQLHSGIGCDCPQTVVLCANRLVWLHSGGRVYTLAGTSPYNENNVRRLSHSIEKEWETVSAVQWRSASAGDYDGYYLLLAGNRVFAMEYACTAFEKSLSASNGDDRRQPGWYCWDFPTCGAVLERLVARDRSAVIVGAVYYNETCQRVLFRLDGETDARLTLIDAEGTYVSSLTGETCQNQKTVWSSTPVPGSFCTSFFDFGRSDRRKSVHRLCLGLNADEGTRLQFTYHTDRGFRQDPFCLTGTGAADWRTLFPNVPLIRQIAIEVSAVGRFSAGALTLEATLHRS